MQVACKTWLVPSWSSIASMMQRFFFFFFFRSLGGLGLALARCVCCCPRFFFWGVSREGGLRKKKRQDDSRLMRSERFRVSKKKLLTFWGLGPWACDVGCWDVFPLRLCTRRPGCGHVECVFQFLAMWHWVRLACWWLFPWGISNLCCRPESESCCLCPHSEDLVWCYKWQKIQLVGMAQRKENPHIFFPPISLGAWLACTKVSGKCIWFNLFCLRLGFNFFLLGCFGIFGKWLLPWKQTNMENLHV